MRLSPLRYTEEIQVKKTRESTRDREEILFEKKSKRIVLFEWERGGEKSQAN